MTPICPTCGCSLVRLGMTRDKAAVFEHDGAELLFCCQGCIESFRESPEIFLEQFRDWIVCPTCLGEKPKDVAISITHDGEEIYFCRCPYCVEEFRKRPNELLDRLAMR